MNNGGKSSISTPKKLAFLAVGIAVFFVLINLLPQRWPLFPAEDSIFRASRLLQDGKCEEGFAIYERLAAKAPSGVDYISIGDDKYEGLCGGQDLKGAIDAYRKAALKGTCSANFYLAAVALKHPNIDGVDQAPPSNNLLAAAICADVVSDQELVEQYFIEDRKYRDVLDIENVIGIRDAFHSALEERQRYLKLPYGERRPIAEHMRDGTGYDANPYPLRWTAARKPLK